MASEWMWFLIEDPNSPLFSGENSARSWGLLPVFHQSLTWIRARAALLKAAGRYASASNCHRSQAPEYQLGQKVWLSTCDLSLRVE